MLLHINRNFYTHGPAGWRTCECNGACQYTPSLLWCLNTKRRFAYGLQHAQLVGVLMDEAPVFVDPLRINLSGEVQERRAGGHRLDQSARCIARACARAGNHHAELATYAGCSVGHIASACLATRRHEANLP